VEVLRHFLLFFRFRGVLFFLAAFFRPLVPFAAGIPAATWRFLVFPTIEFPFLYSSSEFLGMCEPDANTLCGVNAKAAEQIRKTGEFREILCQQFEVPPLAPGP
jgi:hypothetical protein